MTTPITLSFTETDLDALAGVAGNLAVIVPPEGKLDPAGRRLNRLTKGAMARLAEAERSRRPRWATRHAVLPRRSGGRGADRLQTAPPPLAWKRRARPVPRSPRRAARGR
jgi:hypothetical protein